MSLEEQVVSLEYTKKLLEIGFSSTSIFYWTKAYSLDDEWGIAYNSDPCKMLNAAYTAQELLDNVHGCFFHIGRDRNILWLYYSPEHGTDNSYHFTGLNLADLIAQMLIAQHAENQQLN